MVAAVSAHAQSSVPGTAGGLDFVNVSSACDTTVLLPEPTGHHQVGRVTYHWVDEARPDELSEDPHDLRQVIADVFYPAIRTFDGPRAAYVPELDLLRRGFGADSRELPRRIGDDMAVHGCVLTSTFARLPMDDAAEPAPVLLFSPGGNMSRHWHTAWAQEMASQGYVVAVMSHAHSGLDVFPRGDFSCRRPGGTPRTTQRRPKHAAWMTRWPICWRGTPHSRSTAWPG
jgi:predicted dienelactone hydrolase